LHSTDDEDSEYEWDLAKPNFQISMVNLECQKLLAELESQKTDRKGKKKVQQQGQRKSARLNKGVR